MWIYILLAKRFEKTFENAQRRKVKQMQSVEVYQNLFLLYFMRHSTTLIINALQCEFASQLKKTQDILKTLPEAQWTQGIDFITSVISPAKNQLKLPILATRWRHLH